MFQDLFKSSVAKMKVEEDDDDDDELAFTFWKKPKKISSLNLFFMTYKM